MAKTVILCCDGTANQFGHANSNVLKLYSCLKHEPTQIAYYHPGLGTMGAASALTPVGKGLTTLLGLGFGYGLSQHLADLYSFLMRTLDKDDRLCLFGFSRGAYTVRALAGMLHMFGLLRPGLDVNIAYTIRLLKRNRHDRFELAARFKRTFSRTVRVNFLGLFDTVSSVGTIHNPLALPFSTTNPSIDVIRHAIAIDERRAFYRQNLFVSSPGQDAKQVWFAGVHADIGGGYPEAESGLSKLALEWMISEAKLCHVAFDGARHARIMGLDNSAYCRADPTAIAHNSLRHWWWAEIIPRRYGYIDSDGQHRRMIGLHRFEYSG